MILQALAQLAKTENLLAGEPDYEFRRVAWGISINAAGKFQKLISYRIDRNADNDRKANYVGKWSLVPRQPGRSGKSPPPYFLVDTSEYVLGIDSTGKRKETELLERCADFAHRIQDWNERDGNKSSAAIVQFYKQIDSNRKRVLNDSSYSLLEKGELFGFVLRGEWVHRNDSSKRHYSEIRSELGGDVGHQCLVTGSVFSKVNLFPQIKRVPGARQGGAGLVSFNNSTIESHGLDRNENAPISRAASEACAVALTRLLDDRFPNPENWDAVLAPRSIKMGDSTSVCFWVRDKHNESENTLNALANLIQGEDESSVEKNLKSIWYGRPANLRKPSAFYALTISGAQGRAIIRDWLETTLDAVNENLAQHFADLAICRNTQPNKGTAESPAVPMKWLLKSLAAEGRSDPVPPTVESGFIRSAFQGKPYPLQMLQRALVRSRAEAGGDEWIDSMRRDARAAVLKAVLNRRKRKQLNFTDYPEVTIDMNPESRNTGYALGMLIAVLEQLQRLALDDVNASVVDRYFSAASASPKSVFVRLLKNSLHHYRKASKSEKQQVRSSARYMERVKDEILSWLKVETPETVETGKPKRPLPYPASMTTPFGIPSSLSLEDQGLFVLGYHQMRHWIFMKKEARTEWEKQFPNAAAVFLRKKQDEIEKEEPESAAT